MTRETIVLEGVTTHNLKSVTVAIPKGKLVVAAGVSGSGKSSLIMDTLFEHSKSLYLGALSSKSFDMGDGDYHVDRIAGTQPPVALRQRDGGYSNPRSTIGTLTGLDGLYRLLFGAAARPVCPACFGPTEADLRCPECGCFADPLTAQHFSPNRREGKCLHCDGVGEIIGFSLDRIIPDPSKTLTQIWDGADSGTFAVPNVRKAFEAMATDEGIDLNTPFAQLTETQKDLVLHGSETIYTLKLRKVTNDFRFEGILHFLERAYKGASSAARRNAFANYLAKEPCTGCQGGRLRPESLKATVAGHSFHDFQACELSDTSATLRNLLEQDQLPPQVHELARSIIKQTDNIHGVGLGHLQLQRPVTTLSGGELQRLLLAQHLASDLTGVMYVLDEPTAGLHESETGKIIASLRRLRDLGNTVIVIEHDESVIRAADWIIELGPGAGSRGGEVVFEGTFTELLQSKSSPTAAALLSDPPTREGIRVDDALWITVDAITRNNVRDASVTFPVGALTSISGISGAGKSSLVAGLHDLIHRAITVTPAVAKNAGGVSALEDVIYVQQRAVGRSSRSTLATYIGVSDAIRDAFAGSPDALERNLGRAEFSPNVAGGRCETCKGLGLAEIELTLFRSEFILCPDCDGQKFQPHVLEVRLNGLNIHEVLSMTVDDALRWFEANSSPKVVQALGVLAEFGLGYLQLGSSTTTLSGGEAQRLNLANELLKQRRSGTLFIFDEPTRGLHPADIKHLLALFERLISAGNTILVIEHNLRVIALSDWAIDVGPGAGRDGGSIIYTGPPAQMVNEPASVTGQHLRGIDDQRVVDLLLEQPADSDVPAVLASPPTPLFAGVGELLPEVVAVVAANRTSDVDNPGPSGLAIASLLVISEELGLVGFVVRATSSSWALIATADSFCVNILSEGQAQISQTFSKISPEQRFNAIDWELSSTGTPRVAGAYAVLDCTLKAAYQMGDYLLVLANVLQVEVNPGDPQPLLRSADPGARSDFGWLGAESRVS